MKIEFILLGLILLVIVIDFLVKKRKKSSSKEIEKFEEPKNDSAKKPAILKWGIISFVILVLGSLTYFNFFKDVQKKYKYLDDGIYAVFITEKGEIIAKLYYDEAPITVSNFITLSEGNNDKVSSEFKEKKFYDGLTFHRVVKNFMIQGGAPYGNGKGGPGYIFNDEFNPNLTHNEEGVLSMANSGINTNGSQFFITLKATPWLNAYDKDKYLKDCSNSRVGCHSVFGKVVSGMNVVFSIRENDVIKNVIILRKGKYAEEFDAIKVFEKI